MSSSNGFAKNLLAHSREQQVDSLGCPDFVSNDFPHIGHVFSTVGYLVLNLDFATGLNDDVSISYSRKSSFSRFADLPLYGNPTNLMTSDIDRLLVSADVSSSLEMCLAIGISISGQTKTTRTSLLI